MCEPTTIIMGIAAVVGAYATYQSGETQEDFAEYEAEQREADAKAEAGAAQVEADRIRKAGRKAAAEANAAIAASGAQLSSAGSLAINREIYRGAEEDAYFALIGGKDRAARLNASAGLSRARGKAASNAGTLGAFSTALSGAAGVANQWRSTRTPKTNAAGNQTVWYLGNQPGKG